MQHKQRKVSDHVLPRCFTGGEGFVLDFRSGPSGGESPVKEDDRRLVEDGAVMEVDKREDDITSY